MKKLAWFGAFLIAASPMLASDWVEDGDQATPAVQPAPSLQLQTPAVDPTSFQPTPVLPSANPVTPPVPSLVSGQKTFSRPVQHSWVDSISTKNFGHAAAAAGRGIFAPLKGAASLTKAAARNYAMSVQEEREYQTWLKWNRPDIYAAEQMQRERLNNQNSQLMLDRAFYPNAPRVQIYNVGY